MHMHTEPVPHDSGATVCLPAPPVVRIVVDKESPQETRNESRVPLRGQKRQNFGRPFGLSGAPRVRGTRFRSPGFLLFWHVCPDGMSTEV